MDVKNRPVSELVPYANNAKKHDKRQIDNVAESIKRFGFVQPVVVDKDGVIVIGHCRVLAAKKLKMDEVPVVCVDDLTPEQVDALRLIDNKVAESEWDMGLLASELPTVDLSGFDLDWGLDDEEDLEEDKETVQEPETIPESKLYGFAISAFGMHSECFAEILLNEQQAEKLIQAIEEKGADVVCGKLIEAVDNV